MAMSDILRPLKKKLKSSKFASFDTETFSSDNNFYLVGIMHDNKYECFYDIDKFYNYIRTRLKGYVIVATNLSFDLTSIFFNSKYWNEFEILSNSGFMLQAENKKLDIVFRDTLNYHKASVKQLGKIINSPKSEAPNFLGQKPKNPLEEYELREYNKQDCFVTLKFMEWFQNQINSLGGQVKMTLASTSMDIWKRNYNNMIICKEDYMLKKHNIEVNIREKLFKAYYGGRTEVLKRGFAEDLNYYDFNSLYPSVMLDTLPLPNSVQYFKNGALNEILNREGVSHIKISNDTDELPLLPFRQDGKLTFPKGVFSGWYSHIELREAINNGYTILKVYETISYSLQFSPFHRYVIDLYSKRKKAKLKNDSSQLIYKLLMNSLYGKFGERKHMKIKYFDLMHMSKKDIINLQNEHYDKNVSISDSGKGYYTEEETCNSSHVLPIIPIYITAKARIKLWRIARLHDPYYMDTDSIVTKSVLASSKELGELELEHHIDTGIFIKPKMYYFKDGNEEVVKLKGVPHVNLDQFKEVLRGETIKYNKFVKLKEGIRRNLKINSIIEIEKNINLEDNKRLWLKKFDLILEESEPLMVVEQ